MNTEPKTEYVAPQTLIGSQFNPPSRIDERTLADLAKSMKERGFWAFEPIKLGRDGRVADGHRRLAAALRAGIECVPVQKIDMDTAELWVLLNGLRRNFTSQDYAFAYSNGIKKDALELLPSLKPIRNIKQLVEIGGDELIIKIVQTKTSPGILGEAQRLARYCGESRNKEFMLKTINWLIDHKMQRVAKTFVENGLDPILLYKAVTDDKPISLTASVA